MRIRTQLVASIAIATLLCVAMTAGVWRALSVQENFQEAQRRAQVAARESAGLLALTQEFAFYGEERAARQWRKRHAILMDAVSPTALLKETDSTSLRDLRESLTGLPELFREFEVLSKAAEDGLTTRRKQMIVDHLVTNTQVTAEAAYRWAEEVTEQRRKSVRGFLDFFVLVSVVFTLMVVAMAILMLRRIIRPLTTLQSAAAAVRRGDLSVRNHSLAQDELGDLAREFDRMTVALQKQAGALAEGNRALHAEVVRRAETEEALIDEHRRLRLITDNLPALVTHVDNQERYTFVNAQVGRIFGIDQNSMLGKTICEIRGKKIYSNIAPHVKTALGGEAVQFENTGEAQGRIFHYQSNYIPDMSPDGRVNGFYAMTFDITDRKLAELRRAESEQRLRGLTDNLPILIAELDSEWRFRFCNATYQTWMGISPDAIINRPVREAIGEAHYAGRHAYLVRAYAGERVSFEQTLTLPIGERSLQTTYVPRRDPDGAVVGIYSVTSDITDLKETQRQLAALARVDALTGLANRRQLEEHLRDAMARTRRSRIPIAVLYLDIDRFKVVNDAHGHSGGDTVLKEFALRLAGCVRETDLVARHAGDEFVIVLEGILSAAEAQLVAKKIISAMKSPFNILGSQLTVTTSVGVAIYGGGDLDMATLISQADRALYAAKSEGRDRFSMAP